MLQGAELQAAYTKWKKANDARIKNTLATKGGYMRGGTGGAVTTIYGNTVALQPGKAYSNESGELGLPRMVALSPIEMFSAAIGAFLPVLPGGAILSGIKQIAETSYYSVKEGNVNIGGLLSGIGGAIGGISNPITQFIGNAAGLAGNIYSAVTAPSAPKPMALAGPVYSPPPSPMPSPALPTMAGAPVIAAGAGLIVKLTRPILQKIAAKLGKMNVSLSGAIGQIRKMAKFGMGPEAIAFSLGITTAELASLITAHTSKRTRRMNPANGRALRRAIRRVKSFHKLCVHTDVIKPRRRAPHCK